jgi:hypothetical protein
LPIFKEIFFFRVSRLKFSKIVQTSIEEKKFLCYATKTKEEKSSFTPSGDQQFDVSHLKTADFNVILNSITIQIQINCKSIPIRT